MKKLTTFFIFLGIVNLLFAQKEFTVSGYIEDANSREKLIESNVFDLKSSQGTVANNYGFFSLTLPQDSVTLRFSYTGYQTREFKILLNKDIRMDVRLSPSVQLREVEIVGSKVERIEQETQMSRVVVPIEQIKKIPALLGEVDVLKTLQLLPGVQSGGEGQNGLYVRGGSPDQNLILLDGVPVYNVSHLLGFFSVFNADAINNVTLIKGGFPARYGGRLSSVIDINMKEGNLQGFHGEGSIGLISSKLTLEGPIWKEKASFIVSARRTYIDLILKPLISATQNTSTQKTSLSLYFYDLNAKVNYKINDSHRIFLSAYTGKDVLGVSNKTISPTNSSDYDSNTAGTDWGNVTAALRWNFVINKKMFSNTTLTYSQYGFNFLAAAAVQSGKNINSFSAKYVSGIQDWAGKYDFDYIPNPHHYIRAGVGITHHTYNPGAFQFNTQITNVNIDTVISANKTRSVESSIYAEDDIKYGAFRANLGVHASNFAVDGIAYQSVQPRIGLNYLLNNSVAIKGSFTTMTQFINLLTNESLSLPTDLWVPSTAKIKPQQSWQAAAGIAKTIQDEYELSIEAYYKEMRKVISYKEGADFIGTSTNWQDKVTQGNGKAYGLEFFVQKKKGRLTGWVGYTLSWNTRQFADINGGVEYPFKYDRRHDASLVMSYQVSPSISITGTWVYGTGNAISLPQYRYTAGVFNPYTSNPFSTSEVQNIGNKNAFRMNAYHRMDVGIEFFKKKKRWERKFVVGFYNLYNRRNPYYIYSAVDFTAAGVGTSVYKQVSLFPIIPSIAYSFKF